MRILKIGKEINSIKIILNSKHLGLLKIKISVKIFSKNEKIECENYL